jgi:hypothetical protein
MAVAQKMTAQQFLASDPGDHPDFQPCHAADTSFQKTSRLMPGLVELVRRMGGLDAIPGSADCPWNLKPDAERVKMWHAGFCWGAMLKHRESGRLLLTTSRLGPDSLVVDSWHPHESGLSIIFGIPADWTAAPWTINFVSIYDTFSTSASLDALAAEACDFLVGLLNDVDSTYCHIRRDSFVF